MRQRQSGKEVEVRENLGKCRGLGMCVVFKGDKRRMCLLNWRLHARE